MAIPHDTTPPAAPQELQVGGSGTRWLDKADVHWTNVIDNGSPIDTARYQLLDSAGEVLDGTHTVSGDNVQAIDNLPSPSQRGHYKVRVWLADAEGKVGGGDYNLRLWLSDEEGNAGAPATVPLSYECAARRSAAARRRVGYAHRRAG